MSESRPVQDYLQLSTPTDSFLPGDDKQLIDLDELYVETKQDHATHMVMGAEALSLGKFSRQMAATIGLPNLQDYDPFPSKRNSVVGAEGFFTTLYEGFKSFVEGIIKYIRMALSWVANTIKGIFGFRKSERIEQAIEKSLPNLQEEFKTTLMGLGFPAADYNLEAFIGRLPSAVDRVGQLTLMKSKFETDKEAIESLAQALPILQQCVAKLTEGSTKVIKAQDTFKKVIREEFTRTRVRDSRKEYVDGNDSPEANRILVASREVLLAANSKDIATDVANLLSTLYKINFTNEELSGGFDKVRKNLDASIGAQLIHLTPVNIGPTMAVIQKLNARYVEIDDNQMDLTGVDLKALGEAVEKSDAEKILAMADHYNYPAITVGYQEAAVAIRNYTNFCQAVTRQLLVVDRQIDSLTRWYARAHLWYLHGLLGDMEKLQQLNLEARKEGHTPNANTEGQPTIAMEFIRDADVKTFMEKFAQTSQDVIKEDIAELRTKYNNLVKQLGVGKPL